jgi:hypothetical protein
MREETKFLALRSTWAINLAVMTVLYVINLLPVLSQCDHFWCLDRGTALWTSVFTKFNLMLSSTVILDSQNPFHNTNFSEVIIFKVLQIFVRNLGYLFFFLHKWTKSVLKCLLQSYDCRCYILRNMHTQILFKTECDYGNLIWFMNASTTELNLGTGGVVETSPIFIQMVISESKVK